jgi:predicted porin
MNKKLMAVAVAGALAAPGVAFAQASSVTISGIFKVGLESLSYSNTPSTVNRLNKSQVRVVDNSSRIIFGIVEGLGNGMDAVAQLDVRFDPSQASTAPTSNPIGSGNSWVGIGSNAWGMLTMGRWDLHYGKQPDDTAAKAGALEATAVSLMDYVQAGGGGVVPVANIAIANATRTQNVVKYDSPMWAGFAATAAWSANPIAPTNAPATTELDMSLAAAGSPSRKGNAWNFNPSYTNGPFQVGYSYWRAKADAPTGVGAVPTLDQRGDVVYGYYKFGGFKVGLGWNKSKLELATTVGALGAGTLVAERTAWTLPASYVWGPHNIVGHYTKAGRIKSNVPGATTDSTGARMVSLAYVYDLSKRTSLGLTYSQIRNDANANYNFFTSNSLGSTDAVPGNGEDMRMIQATIRHAF